MKEVAKSKEEESYLLNTQTGRIISLITYDYLSGNYYQGKDLIRFLNRNRKGKHVSNIDPNTSYIEENLHPKNLRYLIEPQKLTNEQKDAITNKITNRLIYNKLPIVRGANSIYKTTWERALYFRILKAENQSFAQVRDSIVQETHFEQKEIDFDLKSLAQKIGDGVVVNLPLSKPLSEVVINLTSLYLNQKNN